MKTKGLKIINKKSQNKNKNTAIYYLPYQLYETVPCIGNWDQFAPFKYITVSRKIYMTMTISEYWKKDARRKYYKNKIK